MRRIDELHLASPFAGARMLPDLLRREGHRIGRKQVRTVMARMGIDALYRKPNTSTNIRRIGCTHICSAIWRSPGRTMSGQPISPTFRCTVALCTCVRLWIGPVAGGWRGAVQHADD